MHTPFSAGRRSALKGLAAATVAAPLAGLAGVARAQNDGERPRYGILGQKAPELLVDFWLDGAGEKTELTLAEQQGKWVFIKCWQAWCPGCHASGFPALQAMYGAFKDEPRVQMLGLQTVFEGFGTNTADRVREMQLRYEVEIPFGHDAGVADGVRLPVTMLNYRSGGTPWIIVVNPEGYVAYNDFHVNSTRLIEYLKEDLAKTA